MTQNVEALLSLTIGGTTNVDGARFKNRGCEAKTISTKFKILVRMTFDWNVTGTAFLPVYLAIPVATDQMIQTDFERQPYYVGVQENAN